MKNIQVAREMTTDLQTKAILKEEWEEQKGNSEDQGSPEKVPQVIADYL